MHSTAPAALLAAVLSTVAVTPAAAADIAPPQADALQGQLQGWLQSVLGPDISPTAQVRPEGDHYRIELPFGTPSAGQSSPAMLFASARPVEGGRWTFEGPYIPSPSRFTLNVPVPAGNGKTLYSTTPVEYTIISGTGHSEGKLDPSFATPSTMTDSSQDLQIRAQSALADQLTKTERSSGTYTLRPSGPNQVDLAISDTSEGVTVTTLSQDAPSMEFAAQQTRMTGEITALSRDRAATIIPAIVRLAAGALAGPPGPDSSVPAPPPLADPQLMRVILQSLRGLASEFTASETLDGVTLRFGNTSGAANQVRIGLQAKSDGGLLQAQTELSLDGLAVTELGLGGIADLLPRKVALRPVLTGLPTDEVLHWLGAMSEAGNDARLHDLAMLLRRPGVSVGLDSFAVDLGGASFTGNGMLTTTPSGDLAGQVQITAGNFDELIARVNATPECDHLVPRLIYAKGISQKVGGRLVWNLAYRNGELLINGPNL